MIVSLALVALADAADLLAAPRHADAALFVVALAGLLLGRRLSPRRALTRWSDDDA